jgi:hypothetical protein
LVLFDFALGLPFPLAVPDGAGATSLISTTAARVLVPGLAGADAAADDAAAAAADDDEADARVLCGGGASGEGSVPLSLEPVDDLEEDLRDDDGVSS